MNSSRLPNSASFPAQEFGAGEVPIFATLLERLEISLAIGQRALLSLDVAAVERETREQNDLCREIGVLCLGNAAAPMQHACEVGPRQPIIFVKGATELRAGQARILHLARVQAALLSKAQRYLAILANLRAAPEATYAPPILRIGIGCETSQL